MELASLQSACDVFGDMRYGNEPQIMRGFLREIGVSQGDAQEIVAMAMKMIIKVGD